MHDPMVNCENAIANFKCSAQVGVALRVPVSVLIVLSKYRQELFNVIKF